MSRSGAIVTGGSRGIGRATALRLAGDGFPVAVGYAQNGEQAEKVVAEIRRAGGRAEPFRVDVADDRSVDAMFAAAVKSFGGIDVVVNSAGVLTKMAIATADPDDFDHLFAVNARGAFNVLSAAARSVRDGGRIIMISTSAIGANNPEYGPYAASKAAVEVMARHLAHELRGRGITVNSIAPGPTATDMFYETRTPEQAAALTRLPPLERLGTPEDVAGVASFLAGPDGGWVNAQVIRANGGYV